MDDLISRQAAIDKAIMIPVARIVTEDKVLWRKAVFVEDIEALPSAQPNLDEWCRDCKEYDQTEHCCHRWTKVIRQTVEELKAQPERKKGTWIILIEDLYGSTEATCSECGFEMLVNEPGNGLHDVSDLHYCPNCGADMRKDGDHHEG